MKKCPKCKITRQTNKFFTNKSRYDGLSSYCKECAREYAQTPEYKERQRIHRQTIKYQEIASNSYFLRKYKITYADKLKMFGDQNGCCAICEKEMVMGSACHLDHCHNTGVIRALLCSSCNRGLGYFYDNIKILENAKKYLKKYETFRTN
jgi:hypothetical protein